VRITSSNLSGSPSRKFERPGMPALFTRRWMLG
jgi:hypothetical protein